MKDDTAQSLIDADSHLPPEETALRQYIQSLTDEDYEEMRQPSTVDVREKLRAHLKQLKSEQAKVS